jgi:uncharacterized protein YbcI
MTITQERRWGGSPAAAISNFAVRLLREYTGRGPTKARTTISGDMVVVVLREALLKSELSLVAAGESEAVREMRRKFWHAMRDELVAGVEEIIGRPVIAFLSDNQVDPDIAVEVFILEPDAQGESAAPPD